MTTAFLIVKDRSTRVPNKNFRVLGDRPLFRWVIDALLATSEIEGIVLDTDARARLDAAGLPDDPRLLLVDRASELCGDDVTADALIAANLDRLGTGPVLMTHATSPFLRPATFRAALARFEEVRRAGTGDSLFGATAYQARFWGADGQPLNHDPSDLRPTQELPLWLEENSSLYLFTAESFRERGTRMGTRPVPFATPPLESVDIDTEEDWALADVIARGLTR